MQLKFRKLYDKHKPYPVFTTMYVGWFELQHNMVNHCFMNLITVMCKKRKVSVHLEHTFHGTYFSDCFYKDFICKLENDILDSLLQKKIVQITLDFVESFTRMVTWYVSLKILPWICSWPTNHRTGFRIRCSDRSVNFKSRDKPLYLSCKD